MTVIPAIVVVPHVPQSSYVPQSSTTPSSTNHTHKHRPDLNRDWFPFVLFGFVAACIFIMLLYLVFSSLGHNKDHSDLDTLLLKTATEDNTVFVALVDDKTDVSTFLNNLWFYKNEERLNMKDNLLVAAIDQTAYDRCVNLSLTCYRLKTNATQFISDILQLNYNLILVKSDGIVLQTNSVVKFELYSMGQKSAQGVFQSKSIVKFERDSLGQILLDGAKVEEATTRTKVEIGKVRGINGCSEWCTGVCFWASPQDHETSLELCVKLKA